MADELFGRAKIAFRNRFGATPTVLGRAPGRVELLGNHTDYNDGWVLSAAIDRETVIAARPIEEGLARVASLNVGNEDVFDVMDPSRAPGPAWARYLRGVVWAIGEAYGPLEGGFEAIVVGGVPLGAGLSSSASLQASASMALLGLSLVPSRSTRMNDAERLGLARVLRKSENDFVGVASGLLDQFSSLFGSAGHALTLDCRTLDYERVSMGNPPPAIVVCDSMTSRRLSDGMYNIRRDECDTVVKYFRERRGDDGIRALRDLSLSELESEWRNLDPIARLRARHVLTENDRVLQGIDALRRGDIVAFGRLMSASHLSSRIDFENSSPALDQLIECAESAPGFLGGKLSGAGWAGCTVNLVRPELAEAFADSVRSDYSRLSGFLPDIHICHAADGASVFPE